MPTSPPATLESPPDPLAPTFPEAFHDLLKEVWIPFGIFNPARIKLKAMRKEMPARYWATMPETQLIPTCSVTRHGA